MEKSRSSFIFNFKQVNRFIKKGLIFLICFFIFDKLFYLLVLTLPQLEADDRLEKLIEGEINKDIIIIGSSRGARNIIAGQIENSLNMTAYNLSYPGSDVVFHEYILRTLIETQSIPQIILFVVDDPGELLPSETISFRFSRLYPLVRYNSVIDELIKQGDKNVLSKLFILFRLSRSNFDFKVRQFSKLDTIIKCGSMPISFQNKERLFHFDFNSQKYNEDQEISKKVDSFKIIKELCEKSNIKLWLVFSPNYRRHNKLFENRLRKLAGPDVYYYIYDTLNVRYFEESYFYDEGHLQKCGAKIFTEEITDELKEYIQNK